MIKNFFQKFIESSEPDPDRHNRENVLNVILIGLIFLIALNTINSLISIVVKEDWDIIWRFLSMVGLLILFISLYWYSRRKRHHVFVSSVVVGLFFGLSAVVLIKWGLQDPVASILYSLTIVMAGILLGARFSLYTVGAIALTFLVLIAADGKALLQPDLTWTQRHISVADSASFVTLFAIIAMVSWLFNRQMELSLFRAQRSERALKRQRDLLEIKVKERTRELQAAQLQKIQQFYRFAELGHLSTAFFHDLANFSSSLSIDVDGLNSNKQADIIGRIQKNIRYIDDVVRRVNIHLRSKPAAQIINIDRQIEEVVSIVKYNAQKHQVLIVFNKSPSTLRFRGDLTRFRQLIMNLVTNGVEAYDSPDLHANPPVKERWVKIKTWSAEGMIHIEVADHGRGIAPTKLKKIFEPFYSGKAKGIGIGLFIVRQVVEEDFKGTIQLQSSKNSGTVFTISLPIKKTKSDSK